ncbi:MAG: metallophosphoesterase [Acidobacteria bacterium]|nr:metallophosphoesterase [Acidobacteriota bacterium]
MHHRRDIFRKILGAAGAARSLSAQSAAPLPFLQNVTESEATLAWPPAQSAPLSIEWSSGNGRWHSCPTSQAATWTDLGPSTQQSFVTLSGLPPGGRIAYRGAWNQPQEASFRTPRLAPATFRFLAFGDSGVASDAQFALSRLMAADDPDFTLHTGDIIYPYTTPEGIRERYFDCYGQMMARCPMYISLGNHDCMISQGNPLLSIHRLPAHPAGGRYYSFRWNAAHFIALDTNSLADPAMLAWFDQELLQPTVWRIVFFHHPPYTRGTHAHDPICLEVERLLAPRLESAGVDLVLMGHDHNYQRFLPIGQTTYCVTGGGGAGLYYVGSSRRHAVAASAHHYLRVDVQGLMLRATAIGADGQAIDDFTLSKYPRRTPRAL